MPDEHTPGADGAVSIRLERDEKGWRRVRGHVPAALMLALVAALNGGTCSKQDEVSRKLDELNTRVSRIEGALGVRTASLDTGAEGAGGTSTTPLDGRMPGAGL